jgi:hypothetical protein
MKLYRTVILIAALVLIAGCSQQVPPSNEPTITPSERLFTRTCQNSVCVLDFADGKQCVSSYKTGLQCKWPEPN